MQQAHQMQPYDVARADATRTGRTHMASQRGRSADSNGSRINVHHNERLGSALLGGLALAYGVTRRSPLGTAVAALGSALVFRGVTGHCHAYQALGIDTSDPERDRAALGRGEQAQHIESSLTIQESPEALLCFFTQPTNLTRIMGDFAEVSASDAQRLRWRLHGPLGSSHTWETEVVEERPGELLRFQSIAGSALNTVGTLRLREAPGARGTEVTLQLRFEPPGGALGRALAKLLAPAPTMVVSRALRNFKSLVEAGETPSLKHNPSARASAHL